MKNYTISGFPRNLESFLFDERNYYKSENIQVKWEQNSKISRFFGKKELTLYVYSRDKDRKLPLGKYKDDEANLHPSMRNLNRNIITDALTLIDKLEKNGFIVINMKEVQDYEF